MAAMETAVSKRPNPLQYIIATLPSESNPGLPVVGKEEEGGGGGGGGLTV